MSTTVTENEQVAVAPFAAVTPNEFVVTPTGNEDPLAPPAICVVVAPEQLSVPFGAEYVTLAAQSPGAALVVIFAGQVIVGSWLSTTVTVKEQVVEAPFAAVTLKVLVVTPTGKDAPLGAPVTRLNVAPGQLSAIVGVA